MDSFGIGGMATLGALGAAGVAVTALRVRLRRRRAAARRAPAVRLESLAAAQAELAARLDGVLAEGGAEAKLQAMAGQLLTLIRDKNAAMETAMAGLDQLRARLHALEQIGAPAEARALLGKLGERLDALAAAQAAGAAAVEARFAAIEAPAEAGTAALAERLARLHDQKEAGLAATLDRLGRLEAAVAGRADKAGLDGLAARLEAARTDLGGRLAALEKAGGPFREASEQLTRLYAQKDAGIEAMLARLAPLEAKLGELERGLGEQDPQAALDRFAERLEAVQGRLGALEAAENPFAEISGQLTRLYAQKDAGIEAMLARLAPLEAKLGELERGLGEQDPQAALDRFAERLEAARAALDGRVAALEDAENPFAEVSGQLTRLYAQKDAGIEAMLARLAPLEAKLGELEGGLAKLAPLAGADPQGAVDGLAARVAELDRIQDELAAGLAALRAAAGEAAPLAEVSAQLTRLYAQKDAGLEAMLGRLAPLEARLAALEGRPWDPDADEARAQAAAIAAQLIAARAASEEVSAQTGLFADRLALLEASLPRLSAAQSLLMQALEARAAAPAPAPAVPAADPAADSAADSGPVPAPARPAGRRAGWGVEPLAAPSAAPSTAPAAASPDPAPDASPDPGPADAGAAEAAADGAAELDAIWTLPRLISLHRK